MKSSKILTIIGMISALYIFFLLCTRDFYYINNIPITIYKKTIILGRFYCGFTHPSTDYVILDTYSVSEELYFFNKKEFDLFTASHPKMNMRDYSCKSIYRLGEMSIEEFRNTHTNENSFININMYWDWGRFWPLIYYKTKEGEMRYIHHIGICRWQYGKLKK